VGAVDVETSPPVVGGVVPGTAIVDEDAVSTDVGTADELVAVRSPSLPHAASSARETITADA
jgi:hypothetical protein